MRGFTVPDNNRCTTAEVLCSKVDMNSSIKICALIAIASVVVVSTTTTTTHNDASSCNCVPVKQCQELLSLVLQKPLLPSTITELRKYYCGHERKDPKVCCPGVLEHKNAELLPKTLCGSLGSTADKIIRGERAEPFDFPWMALLSYEGKGTKRFLCTGSLINRNYVLTSARCLRKPGFQKLVGVRLGENNLKTDLDCISWLDEDVCAPPAQDFDIGEIIVHEHFDPKHPDNDIGLIRLASPINVTGDYIESIQPICLPFHGRMRNPTFAENTSMIANGWNLSPSLTPNDFLLRADLYYLSNEECSKRFNESIINRNICAFRRYNNLLIVGDIGSPLEKEMLDENHNANFYQYGILSYQIYSNRNDITGVYTNVLLYIDWILDNIKP